MFNTFGVIKKNHDLQIEVDQLAQEVALIEVQNQNLRYNIDYYRSESYLETEAKRRFNLAAPGESVVLLEKDGDNPIPDRTPATDSEPKEIKPQYQQNWDSWMTFLFGRVE